MSMITSKTLPNDVLLLTIETPGPVNSLSTDFNTEFREEVDAICANTSLKGVIITSAKDDFAVGGNLDELRAAMTPSAVAAIVDPFTAALRLLETCGKPVVAALNGTSLGGGYELALGCHYRIAADRDSTRIGLPEAGLGLMPGAGGTQRLPRLIGIAPAAALILRGKTLPVADALEAGLIDAICAPNDLIAEAQKWISQNPEATQPWDNRGFTLPGDDPNSKSGRMWFAGQWAGMRKRSAGTDAATTAILYCLHHGMERRLDAALQIERRQFIALASSAEAKNKIRTLFYGMNAARPKADKSVKINHLGIVGGGMMGNGIAFSAARAGLRVTLIEISDDRAKASRDAIAGIAARQVKRGRMSDKEAATLNAAITCTTDYSALKSADFAIEAVFEQRDVKQDVYAKLAAVLRPDVTIASNTSTIPIADLSSQLDQPDRMIGMHFFAPVEVMKLLEIIHTDSTSDKARSEAAALAAKMRKSVITVKDGLGFYTSRIVSSLSSEAMTLLAEGVTAQLIDNVMTNSGFAVGGATLADLTKLPLLADIMASMSGKGSPVSMQEGRAPEALSALIDAGRSGKLAGKGIYDYSDDGPEVWAGLADLFPAPDVTLAAETVRQRLVNTQSLEAVRALDDGTVLNPETADVAAVIGWGYPVHLGGPFAYIDTVGAAEFVTQCDALTKQFGDRFTVPMSLRKMAETSAKFHAL